MTIAVAVFESPTSYRLAADTRVSTGGGAGVALTVVKALTVGRWFFAGAGDGPAVVRFRKLLSNFAGGKEAFNLRTRADVEDLLEQVHEKALEITGGTEPGEYHALGAELLFVGPAGVGAMGPTGDVYWRDGAPSYAAVGCAFEFAMGWIDRAGTVTVDDAESTVAACCDRFPACGRPITVLDSAVDIVEPVAPPKRSRTETGPAAQVAGDGGPPKARERVKPRARV